MTPVQIAAGIAIVALGVAVLVVRGAHDARGGHATRAVFEFLGAAFGVGFAVLTAWTLRLPVLRGSAWSIKDTLVRAGAILCGVVFLLSLLTALLPWVLDRLEGRTFTSFVGARHVRSPKSGFLTVISVLSICGVALSSCALSSVVSVMGGFSQDLKRKILGNNAHIVVDQESNAPWEDWTPVLDRLRLVAGVRAATPVVQSEVMASSASNLAGVIVRGVDPGSIGTVIDMPTELELGKLSWLEHPEELLHLPADTVIGIGPGGEQYLRGNDIGGLDPDLDPSLREVISGAGPLRPGIIIGRELAKTLHVYIGDEITLVSPLGDLGPMGIMPRTKRFRVAGIFFSGMYEYDAGSVYITLPQAQDFFGAGEKITLIEVKTDDPEKVQEVTPRVVAAVEQDAGEHPDRKLRVRDWIEMNHSLFSALALEKVATFVILSIAIMVASFCIICTLLLMVTEKAKEIAILKALGASDDAILRTFMTEGIIIGAIGTVFGVATSLGLCLGLSWFGVRLDPDIYYIDRLPIAVNGVEFVIVALAAMTICTLATLYPAHAASTLRPVEGLRYE